MGPRKGRRGSGPGLYSGGAHPGAGPLVVQKTDVNLRHVSLPLPEKESFGIVVNVCQLYSYQSNILIKIATEVYSEMCCGEKGVNYSHIIANRKRQNNVSENPPEFNNQMAGLSLLCLP